MPAPDPDAGRNRVRLIQPEDLPVLSVDGLFGGLDPIMGRLLLYADRPEVEMHEDGSMSSTAIVRTLLAELRMSPETFIGVARWMEAQADRYEAWCSDTMSDRVESAPD